MANTESRQAAWWPTYEFLTAVVDQANLGPLPAAGTPAWCQLAEGDPRKLLALAESGVHHVLRIDTEQEARAQASRDVAESVDCQAIARGVQRQHWRRNSNVYIPREVA